MKTYKKISNSIRNFVDLLISHEIAVIINPVIERRTGNDVRITWKSPTKERLVLNDNEFATVGEYRTILKKQEYTAVLYDGAVLQISFDFDSNQLVGHRMCYYPCPLDIDYQIIRSEPILDAVDLYLASRPDIHLRSPLRFDYDSSSAAHRYSKTHVHLNKQNCRFSVAAPISLGHFIHFIFYHFYPDIWQAYGFLREWPKDFYSRTITDREEVLLHLAFRQTV